MKIIKRSGAENTFDKEKIENAVAKANITVEEKDRLSEGEIGEIAQNIEDKCSEMNRAMDVETIQDWVEADIMRHGKYTVAKHYITYRYERSIVRQANTPDKQILSLLNFENEEVKQENSNKNPTVNSVQRDYMAGEVSKDITRRFLLPDDIVEAHEKGLIHFHDADYFAQHMHNCCLVNLEDMLQNGTVISEVMIEKPHSFSTACNIATQSIAQIASSQYGGQSITLSHLAPFVQISRDKYRREVKKEFAELNIPADEDTINKVAEMRVKAEIVQGVQMIQYQVITLMTTNGQAPFVTVFMYLDEVPEGQTRDDLAAIIEEMLRQRIQGVKNEKGVYITPAFPKLIYVLEEDNIREGSKYWELTSNFALTWRAPHVHELYSNGNELGSGMFVRGDASMNAERSHKWITSVSYRDKVFHIRLDSYLQWIKGYIYDEPLKENITVISGTYPVFRYRQTPAFFRGADFDFRFMPAASWEYHLIASFIRANEQGTGNYLPYIPSFHLSHELAWTHQTKSHILFRLTARHKFVAKQNRFNPATDLIPYTPPAYHLFGAEASMECPVKYGNKLTLTVTADNLLNREYKEYTNRSRYYAHDMGRDIRCTLNWNF